ncbi:MAG: hypothetical protein GXY67_06845 [Clostridiales bacterium]|nr:hypothetical protein [Clostridiales bacterium]
MSAQEGKQEAQGRMWIRLMKAHKCLRDVVLECRRDDPRNALRQALPQMDISQPLWLPRHQADWEQYSFTRFLPEHFMDSVSFDRMEISYIFPEEESRPSRKRNPLEDA